ncbi:elongation factor G [Actinocatenispora rupis]|uniref:Tetracycline resistance protein, tetM/tetO subfamily n=1 Tax=Actinocatenispora rupis TaxID=519421 RepID=A0A8J3NBR7_9ACTN|nr:TetM/TetW/TetO/TetS family tetracycline resistance ribosomal protection protein [Actinocatenispora rupis]GID13341.1 tetracycline resistance protein, tetM/tetO subfamily [Actinocatenispora rupis]
MALLNLGILAHVDAGKTSLTERILFHTGVLARPGSVDAGSTVTDSMALERERGITIRSAVVSFELPDGLKVNLIDTPGHADFIAEVDRALRVLDGVVLVVSAVEGVQPQTRRLMRALRAVGLPTVLFVNKVDRAGAREYEVLHGIRARLSPDVLPLSTVDNIGTRGATVRPVGPDAAAVERLAELRADHDDDFLAAYLAEGWRPSAAEVDAELRRQSRAGRVHPVYFGSAMTGVGVDALLAGVSAYLPRAGGRAADPLSGTVFAIRRGARGERLAYLRLFGGTFRNRVAVPFHRDDGTRREVRPTAVELLVRGGSRPVREAGAGEIVQVTGLTGVRIGDRVGTPGAAAGSLVPPPTLESVVTADPVGLPVRGRPGGHPVGRADLWGALGELAEQDPMIAVRTRGDGISVCLFGEVQKEVLTATLAAEYGIGVTFAPTSAICVERPVGSGAAHELITDPANRYFATVGLRVDPIDGEEVEYRLEVEAGSLLPAFRHAVEETVRDVLRQGPYGWRVVGCRVTLTHSGYWAPMSAAGDFRGLVPLVLANALREAGTVVYQPVRRFEATVPVDTVGEVLAAFAAAGGTPGDITADDGTARIEGTIGADAVHTIEQRLPRITRGEGDLTTTPHGYSPAVGAPPRRPRTGPDPFSRKDYLREVITSR